MVKKALSDQQVPLEVLECLGNWGAVVRNQRITQRLTLQALAQRAGVSAPTLMRVERGDPAVAAGTYLTALAALGVMDLLNPSPPPNLISAGDKKRVRLSSAETGDDFGYF